ncbi:uncharacterized protein HaLaN_09720, partial [Haematococcus lacustris]
MNSMADCEVLLSEVSRLEEQRASLQASLGQEQAAWQQQYRAESEALQRREAQVQAEAERAQLDAGQLAEAQAVHARELQAWAEGEEGRLRQARHRVEQEEARLHTLSVELAAREKEVASLQERVRAELEAARQLAATTASDRAQL